MSYCFPAEPRPPSKCIFLVVQHRSITEGFIRQCHSLLKNQTIFRKRVSSTYSALVARAHLQSQWYSSVFNVDGQAVKKSLLLLTEINADRGVGVLKSEILVCSRWTVIRYSRFAVITGRKVGVGRLSVLSTKRRECSWRDAAVCTGAWPDIIIINAV